LTKNLTSLAGLLIVWQWLIFRTIAVYAERLSQTSSSVNIERY